MAASATARAGDAWPAPVATRVSACTALRAAFELDCCDCVLHTYPTMAEPYQKLSTLVDYGYLEEQRGDNVLTEYLRKLFPGHAWDEGDYGVTEEATPLPGASGRTVAVYYIRIPWTQVSARTAAKWFGAAVTRLVPARPLFDAAAMAAPGPEWSDLTVLELPLAFHQAVRQAQGDRPTPWVTLHPVHYRTEAILSVYVQTLPRCPVPVVYAGANGTTCNVLYNPLRLPMWNYGARDATHPTAGKAVTDCVATEIRIFPSCELVGMSECWAWSRWRAATHAQARELSTLVLAAACASVLIRLPRELDRPAPSPTAEEAFSMGPVQLAPHVRVSPFRTTRSQAAATRTSRGDEDYSPTLSHTAPSAHHFVSDPINVMF